MGEIVFRDLLSQQFIPKEGVWLSKGVDIDQVVTLEHALGYALPVSYREFLLTVGAMAIGDSTISGITDEGPFSRNGGSMLGDTERSRAQQALPPHLAVIQANEDAPYCLSLGRLTDNGECKVVCFEVASGITTHIADSFADWFAKFYWPGANDGVSASGR